jgi:putative acetyltransferase
MPQTQLSLRPATEHDVPSIARLHRRSFQAALPWIPSLHTTEEDLAFFSTVTRDQSVLVCEVADQIVGFVAWGKGWVNHLYVDPGSQRRGVGRALLTSVIEQHQQSPSESTFQLWTFQRNFGARRFYEVHGLVPVEFTDGASNEEREPDIRYRWRESTNQASAT